MIAMPERLTDADYIGQAGLSVAVTLPVQELVPSYVALGEANIGVRVLGGAIDGDAIKFLPMRPACDQYLLLPVTDPWYAQCACSGAAVSNQGGALLEGRVSLPSSVLSEGPHIVCHAFHAGGASIDALSDGDYEPQRGVQFEGVNRSTALSTLLIRHQLDVAFTFNK